MSKRILSVVIIALALVALAVTFHQPKAEAATKLVPSGLHLQVLASCPSGALHCVGLSVGAPASGAVPTGYNIYKASVSGGCSTLTATTCSKITTLTTSLLYNDNNLAGSTTFFYVATAFNATGEGPASAQQSATTGPDPVPNAPTLSIVGVK